MTVEMNNIPWSPVLRYATPLPMNRNPVSTVALQHKSVSSVLRYATPLSINRTPFSTVGGLFPPFCGTPTPPDEQDPVSPMAGRTQGHFLRSAVRQASFPSPVPSKPVGSHAFRCLPMNTSIPLPPDEHDAFRCLPMNTTTMLFLRSDLSMYTSRRRTYA